MAPDASSDPRDRVRPPLPSLLAFFDDLKQRLTLHISGGSRLKGPLQAISETPDSFLIDSIAQQNKRYCSIWPANRELDEQALVDGFVALVLQVHKLDAKLQKRFDQVVPKKTTETTFVRA